METKKILDEVNLLKTQKKPPEVFYIKKLFLKISRYSLVGIFF